MSTYGGMRVRIADELKRSDLSSQINLAIKSAIRHYEPMRWWHNEARTEKATVASQEYYALPTNFVEADHLLITVNTHKYELRRRTQGFMNDNYVNSNTYTGIPEYWAIYDDQVRLGPVPDDSYTLELQYQKELTELSASSDTNDWMTRGEQLIRARAKWDLFTNQIRDMQQAQIMKSQELEALDSIEERAVKYQSGGGIRPYY